ncbi:hypothetical protein Q5752_001207 [Cryptotrichosporon argae]
MASLAAAASDMVTMASSPDVQNGESSTSPAGRRKRRADPLRPKNLQACDRCRIKKVKCEPPEGTAPGAGPGGRSCAACETTQRACTFDLPLTVSRSKRVRRGLGATPAPAPALDEAAEDGPPYAYAYDALDAPSPVSSPRRPERALPPLDALRAPARMSVRREGPTSLSYILHSTPTLPLPFVADWAAATGKTVHVTPAESGDGYVLCAGDGAPPAPRPPFLDVVQSDSWGEVVSRLAETFLVHVGPLVPVVARDDMAAATPGLLHTMAAVAAARTNCPQQIFETLQHLLRKEILDHDTLSDPTRHNIQILLVSCLVDELAIQPGVAQPAHVARTRLSAAIRMAQDLGMDTGNGADWRIWQCAMVIDQWNAARHGVRPIAILPPPTYTPDDTFFAHLVQLTSVLARVLVTVYGPEGIKHATNDGLHAIRDALAEWNARLPAALAWNGLWSSLQSGILHLLYTTTLLLLYRPFMRWSFMVPPALELNMGIPEWTELLACSRGCIEWAANQEELADLLFVGPYALGICGLIQYHTWARRREADGVVLLEKARRDVVERWTARLPDSHHPLQRAQLDVVKLLHAATQRARPEGGAFAAGDRGLNPTPGSLNRLPETTIAGVAFIRDPSHPRGGVLVATQQAAREIKDLPPGTVVLGGAPDDDAEPPQQVTPATQGYIDALIDSAAVTARPAMSAPEWEAYVSAYMLNADSGPSAFPSGL